MQSSKKISSSVFVTYFTEGRDKYEYHTHLVGVFTTFQTAAFQLVQHLNEHAYISSCDGKEDESSVPNRTDWTKETVKEMVQHYHDSFYKDGSDYTIAPVTIGTACPAFLL